jgi:hypothetical protein
MATEVDVDMAANRDIDMTSDMDVNVDTDMDDDGPYIFGPISNVTQIF